MPANITSEQVWREVSKRNFAVLGFVTSRGEARSAGVVYTVRDRNVYIVTDRDSWKVRHIRANSHVSLTVTIPKRIPLLPWIQIPQAVICFHGEASIHEIADVPPDVPRLLLRGLKLKDNEKISMIRVRPVGQFLTYGVGVPLITMRDTQAARSRAPV